MSKRAYTSTTERGTYLDQNDQRLLNMLLPFILGLALGWGANELADSENTNRASEGGTSALQSP